MQFAPGHHRGNDGRAFLVFAVERLLDLVEGGWDNEYPGQSGRCGAWVM